MRMKAKNRTMKTKLLCTLDKPARRKRRHVSRFILQRRTKFDRSLRDVARAEFTFLEGDGSADLVAVFPKWYRGSYPENLDMIGEAAGEETIRKLVAGSLRVLADSIEHMYKKGKDNG